MPAVEVRCGGDRESGWTCDVRVHEAGRELSSHRVAVSADDLERLDPATSDPTSLVERSFAFLLEREPPGSILRSFELPVIGRYFPEYEATIRRGR
jgi:hypothetical protein